MNFSSLNLPPVILASASPRRAQLLREAGLEFQVVAGTEPEVEPIHLPPGEIARYNARKKATAVARQYPTHLVLAADTVVALGTTVFGKPSDLAEAKQMLHELQGRTHHVITGVYLFQRSPRRERLFAVSTRVTFHPLSEVQIAEYVSRVNTLDKAGGYAIQECGDLIVEGIDGSYSNVVGLPLEQLEAELVAWQNDFDLSRQTP